MKKFNLLGKTQNRRNFTKKRKQAEFHEKHKTGGISRKNANRRNFTKNTKQAEFHGKHKTGGT